MDAARTWSLWMAGALPKCAGQTLPAINVVRAREPDQRVRLGCFCRWRNLSRGYRFGRLFRLFRLRLQRQNARDSVLVRVNALLVSLDPEPNARRLEQENLGVFHLFVDTKRVAQILQGLAADRLRLLTGVQVRDPLPNLSAFVIAFDDLPSQGEVIAVARVRLLNAGLDNLGDVFADWQHVPGITFLRRWVKGFGKLRRHRSAPLLGGFGVRFAVDDRRRRLRWQVRSERPVTEILRHRHLGRQVVAVLGDKAWSCLEVQPALRSAVGTVALLAESDILPLHVKVWRKEADRVAPVLHQAARPLVQAQLI